MEANTPVPPSHTTRGRTPSLARRPCSQSVAAPALLGPFTEERQIGFPQREKRLGHVIMPRQILFVQQSPQYADAAGAKTQPASDEPQGACRAVGRIAVE